MRIAVSGARGLIGSRLVALLRERGDEVTVLSRGAAGDARWDPATEPAPPSALAGHDAVVHLAGESVAQRWSAASKARIRDSRVRGTENLIAGLQRADPRPGVLVCASAVGYYGDRGDERLEESAPPGGDFLAGVCREWEQAAAAASTLGMRVVSMRTGVVLARSGGALRQMLPPFRLGLGGPIAGGHQYMPWISLEDIAGLYVAAIDDERFAGAINATAPQPVTNREFTKTLGRVLHRPAFMPLPAVALRAMFGEMAEVLTGGQNAVPARALELGYRFRHAELEGALRVELG